MPTFVLMLLADAVMLRSYHPAVTKPGPCQLLGDVPSYKTFSPLKPPASQAGAGPASPGVVPGQEFLCGMWQTASDFWSAHWGLQQEHVEPRCDLRSCCST